VDEECKETRLQGLKDQLAVSDDFEADVLRQEVERLEQEIEELTEFSLAIALASVQAFGPEWDTTR
jgi:polyhydroxyalkanoate synthesis regulator phasin